jgi:hypothetical protein
MVKIEALSFFPILPIKIFLFSIGCPKKAKDKGERLKD